MPKFEPSIEQEALLATKARYSPSRVLTYLKCPAYFQFRYLMPQIEEPKSPNLFLGSAVHKILEMAFAEKISTGSLPRIENMLAAHDDLWADAGSEMVENMTGDIVNQKLMSAKMVKTYLTERAPKIDPVEVESEWYLEIPGKKYFIHGIIDLVSAYNAPETKFVHNGKEFDRDYLAKLFTLEPDNPLTKIARNQGFIYHEPSKSIRVRRVHDFKTVGRTPSQEPVGQGYAISPDYELQLTWYALMVSEGQHDVHACLDYITKTANPKCLEAATVIKGTRCNTFLKTLDTIHAAIETKLYYPNRASKYCGTGCEFWDVCHSTHG